MALALAYSCPLGSRWKNPRIQGAFSSFQRMGDLILFPFAPVVGFNLYANGSVSPSRLCLDRLYQSLICMIHSHTLGLDLIIATPSQDLPPAIAAAELKKNLLLRQFWWGAWMLEATISPTRMNLSEVRAERRSLDQVLIGKNSMSRRALTDYNQV